MREKFYNELVRMRSSNSLPDVLGWMATHGQSVILNWGEDDNLWECSWIISSGKRFTRFDDEPMGAAKIVLSAVRIEALEHWPEIRDTVSK